MRNILFSLLIFLQLSCFGQCKIDSSSIANFCFAFRYGYKTHNYNYGITSFCYVDNSTEYISLNPEIGLDSVSQNEIFYDILFTNQGDEKLLEKFLFEKKVNHNSVKKLSKYMICKYGAKLKAYLTARKKYELENCEAEFNGGIQKMMIFIEQNLKYPYPAMISNLEGKVFVEFLVNRYGILVEAKVVKSLGYGCDEEALRLVNAMPRWRFGLRNGKPISERKTIPISFKLPK